VFDDSVDSDDEDAKESGETTFPASFVYEKYKARVVVPAAAPAAVGPYRCDYNFSVDFLGSKFPSIPESESADSDENSSENSSEDG
jgi:hypothetical protein